MLKKGDRVRVVRFDEEGVTENIYTGKDDPIGMVGAVNNPINSNFITITWDKQPDGDRLVPYYFKESELEVISEE